MLKFIHGADFHLDSAFGALPARQAAGRRRESRELPFRLANLVNVDKAAEDMFAGTGYYVDEALAPYFRERLETIYETPYALARSLEGYDYTEDGSAPYGYSYIRDGRVRICMEVPHEMGDYIEIELGAQ